IGRAMLVFAAEPTAPTRPCRERNATSCLHRVRDPFPDKSNHGDIAMNTVLITGANRGIGLALTQTCIARGDRVIGVCRESSDALRQTGARIETGIDVGDDAAVADLARRIDGVRLD